MSTLRTANPNATLRRFYRWNAPIYDLTRWTILRGRAAAIAALRLLPGGRVLEIGCGTGLSFRGLLERVGCDGAVVGLDLSPEMLARASRRRQANVHLIRADAARLALADRFDGVLACFSLTMVPDWRAAIARACAHLVPGGTIVVLDFAPPVSFDGIFRRIFHRYLSWNHVDTGRDIKGVLEESVSPVEQLAGVPVYLSLLRGTAAKPGD